MGLVVEGIRCKMEYIEEITQNLGFTITKKDYYIEDMGCPHTQPKLPQWLYRDLYFHIPKR